MLLSKDRCAIGVADDVCMQTLKSAEEIFESYFKDAFDGFETWLYAGLLGNPQTLNTFAEAVDQCCLLVNARFPCAHR